MPEPLRGLVAIAEYGSKIEVDLAVAALTHAGITATASYDPAANTAAPFLASDRTFELLVHEDDAEAAVARLHEVVDDLPPEFDDGHHGPGRRPRGRRRERLRRWVIVGIVVWFAAPALLFTIIAVSNG